MYQNKSNKMSLILRRASSLLLRTNVINRLKVVNFSSNDKDNPELKQLLKDLYQDEEKPKLKQSFKTKFEEYRDFEDGDSVIYDVEEERRIKRQLEEEAGVILDDKQSKITERKLLRAQKNQFKGTTIIVIVILTIH